MKKYLVALLVIVCAIFCAIGVSACVPDGLEAHNWSEKWESNATQHWRRCLDTGCNGRTDKADHEWEVTTVYQAATCGETGLGQFTCTVCNATMGNEKSPATIPATGKHDWELISVQAEPTCGQEGTGDYTCKVCLKYSVFPVPATGNHDYSGNYIITKEGHYHKCLNDCGVDEEMQPHVEGEPVRYEPTGNMDGSIQYRCTYCNFLMRDEVIPNPNALYRIEVAFVKSSRTVVPKERADGELYAILEVDTMAMNGYTIEVTGYTINGDVTEVPEVGLYYYDEFTTRKTALTFNGDETNGYMGYVNKKFYINYDVADVCLMVECEPAGRAPVSVIIHIYTGKAAPSAASVNLTIPETVPVYYLEKKVNV